MQNANLAIMFSEGPALVADQGFTTGRVDLTSFEEVLSPTTMKIGRVGAFGCYPEAFAAEEREKGSSPDQFRHEIGTAYNLKGAWPYRSVVLLASWHRQHREAGASRLRRFENPCDYRRLSSRAVQGRLCA